MSNIELHERLTLDSPPDRVWSFLIDPYKTVSCLPGSELTGQEDERTFAGAVKVKVGAVRVAYGGTVVFEEVDADRRFIRLVGRGREKTGSGSAEMTMESTVIAVDGGSEVTIDAEIRVTGKLVRFGRGMIETVSAEILEDFRTRLGAKLAAEEVAARADAMSAPGGAATVEGKEDARDASVVRPHGDDEAISLVRLLARAFRTWLSRTFGRG
jgi:carbon monoxide dehydrogenase subunit G